MIDLSSIDLDRLEFEGITQPVMEWALDYGIPASLIADRLARGWPAGLAITTPMQTRRGARLPLPKPTGDESGTKPRRPRGKAPRLHELNGERLTLAQWAERAGLTLSTVRYRLSVGSDLATALEPHRPRERMTFNGKDQSLVDWSRETGISRNVLYERRRLGWSVERTLTEPVEARKRRGASKNFQNRVGDRRGKARAIPSANGDFALASVQLNQRENANG